jgi:hypothetical protein
MKRVIRSDKPVNLLLLLWSHKCDFGAEPRSRIIATSVVKELKFQFYCYFRFSLQKRNVTMHMVNNVVCVSLSTFVL